MRIGVLTTDTTHHRYFLHSLNQEIPVAFTIVETKRLLAPFETAHPFEAHREKYELEKWGVRAETPFHQMTEVLAAQNINEPTVVKRLKNIKPDLLIDFGTCRVLPSVIETARIGAWNLHGGDPEEYRGLDSHLWAVYHGDFSKLVTTLHVMEPLLDTGAIIGQDSVPLFPKMKIEALRAANTEVCVRLVIEGIKRLQENSSLPVRAQIKKGRYYSFMPAVLKNICVEKFEKYTDRLA